MVISGQRFILADSKCPHGRGGYNGPYRGQDKAQDKGNIGYPVPIPAGKEVTG